jgi:hypothetical protein
VKAAVILEASKSKMKQECADLVPPVLVCKARVFDLCKNIPSGQNGALLRCCVV